MDFFNPNEHDSPALVQQDTRRAEAVLQKIDKIAQKVSVSSLDLAELLSETMAQAHYKARGFTNFEDYVAQAKLGVGKRQAFYLVKIWDTSDALSIAREDLEAAGISKLKVIFTLNPETHKEEILGLVKEAPELTVEELNEKIKALKEGSDEDFTWRNHKVLRADAEAEIDPCYELVRANAGDTLDLETGGSKSLSDGQILVHICQAYRQDPNNLGDQIGEMGDFEDSMVVGGEEA